MWLIDSINLSLRQIADKDLEREKGSERPRYRYGILSHRWDEDHEEATFEEYAGGQPSRTKKGTRKIEDLCRVARSEDLSLVWADTCCIDKRSSAELQEEINSMYRYYQRADICFTYLGDVDVHTFESDFNNSEWFTRGWTLQELLASYDLRFYDRNWVFLGDKYTLAGRIHDITGIPGSVLQGVVPLQQFSAAQKMSWAARRKTSRIEDRAYSLLGIFDVNMAMLYGEGPKLFMRLQEEIIKTWDDPSLFAWEGIGFNQPGLLATAPDAFASSGDVSNLRDRKGRRPYVLNNRGLYGTFPLIPYTLDTYLSLLPCTRLTGNERGPKPRLAIFLRRLFEDDQFMRTPVFGEDLLKDADAWLAQRHGFHVFGFEREISIRQRPLLPDEIPVDGRLQGFRLSESLLMTDERKQPLFRINGEWDAATRILSLSPGRGNVHSLGIIDIGPQQREIETIRLGFDRDYNPLVYLTTRAVTHRVEVDMPERVITETFEQEGQGYEDTSRVESFPSDATGMRLYHNRQGNRFEQTGSRVNGLWALNGDRLSGLDVVLMRDDHGEMKTVGHVSLSRITVQSNILWELQIHTLEARTDLDESDPRHEWMEVAD